MLLIWIRPVQFIAGYDHFICDVYMIGLCMHTYTKKLQKLEDALRMTRETGETGGTGETEET